MKQLVLFSLSKRFRNRMTVIMNILMFIVIGVLVHLNYIIGSKENIIYIDSSLAEYHQQFLKTDHDDLKYQIADGEGTYLHYEDGWYLYSDSQMDEKVLEEVRNDIIRIVSSEYYEKSDLKTRGYIDEFNRIQLINLYVEGDEEDTGQLWIIISVIYFIILSYSNLVANEVVYEKATNTLGIILTSVTEREHFLSKILTAYLSLMIQGLLAVIGAVFWIIERFIEDRLQGLIRLAVRYMSQDTVVSVSQLSTDRILSIIILVLAGILTIQTLMLIMFSGFTNSDDVSVYQGPFYIVMVAGYYFLLIKGTAGFFRSVISVVLSYLPIISMVFMPCRIFIDSAGVLEIIISIFISLITFFTVLWFGVPFYRKRILNDKRKMS